MSISTSPGKQEFSAILGRERGLPCYSPEQGLKSAEQGFIPHEQAI
jgi:hypothetical protein